MLRPAAKIITDYTIFTTTDCNARCFYCFEKNAARIPMSPGSAEKTAGFIAGHCGGNEVSISWFGGEPLYNMEAIDIICRGLRERGIPFNSKIVSNGYLFDREIIGRAKVDWELRSVQITLDGTEDVYNKAKAYIYKGVNAFRRVIGNIHLLLDAGIAVDIRLNIDTYNADNLTAFKEVYPEIEACGDCPLYPDCFRLVKCDECRNCFPENRADWLSQMRYEMRSAFYGRRKIVSPNEAITDSKLC